MLARKTGYRFKDRSLIEMALTHSSYANEAGVPSNERLEFLGDAVLGCVITWMLYERFPEDNEGALSKRRGAIVCGANFARLAKKLGLDKELRLGKGEETSGGREKESNLAGAFEALIGAVYLDGGFEKARKVIEKVVGPTLDDDSLFSDYKTELQEMAQKCYKRVPRYRVVKEEGPPHARSFHVEVTVAKKKLGRGKGKSKKDAEQAAAKIALQRLKKEERQAQKGQRSKSTRAKSKAGAKAKTTLEHSVHEQDGEAATTGGG